MAQCTICNDAKGKRACMVNARALICPPCCAQTRGTACEGCGYYAAAKENLSHRAKASRDKPFTARIDPAVDEEVDRALAMLERGQSSQAESSIAELLERHPDLHVVHFAQGVVHALREELADAVRCFTRAVEIFPYYSEAWHNKATAHRALRQVNEAVRAYQKVVAYGDRSNAHVLNAQSQLEALAAVIRDSTGLTLEDYLRRHDAFDAAFREMEAKQWESAVARFKTTLMIDPRHHQSYGNLGLCYAALGRNQEAIAALDKAIELDPSYEPAILGKAFVERLAEGEKLDLSHTTSINYTSDYQLTGKSLAEDFAKPMQ